MHNFDYIKLYHLKIFFEVARLKNFSAAAQSLHMTPTLVSKKIIRLEEDLNMKLFDRTTRTVELTHAGEYLYLNAQQHLNALEICYNAAYRLYHDKESTIVLGAMNTADMNQFLFSYTNEFLAQHSDVKLSIVSEYMLDLLEGIENRRFDLVVVTDFLIHRVESMHLNWCYWMKGPSNVVIPKNHPLSSQPSVSLAEIKNERFSFLGGNNEKDYLNYIREIFLPIQDHIKPGNLYANPYTLRDTFGQDQDTIFFTDQYFTYFETENHVRMKVKDHESGVIAVWQTGNERAEKIIKWLRQAHPVQ